jgi:inner membrane protein involved in colicin E2 resistance
MNENFFVSMVSEGGKISHKRVISFITALVLCFSIVWTIVKYEDFTLDTIHSTMLFILVMSGVATVAQIVSLWKGGNPHGDTTKDDKINQPTTP